MSEKEGKHLPATAPEHPIEILARSYGLL
jgi:hypothetical protein